MPKVKELIKELEDSFNPEDTIAYLWWSREDVGTFVENYNEDKDPMDWIDLSEEEQDEVVERMHDRIINDDYGRNGVDWDDLEEEVMEVIAEREAA